MHYSENLARITIDLPESLQKKIKALAAIQGITLRKMVIKALEHEVALLGEDANTLFKKGA